MTDAAQLTPRIEVLPVDTDAVARVVINERTGTVVVVVLDAPRFVSTSGGRRRRVSGKSLPPT